MCYLTPPSHGILSGRFHYLCFTGEETKPGVLFETLPSQPPFLLTTPSD